MAKSKSNRGRKPKDVVERIEEKKFNLRVIKKLAIHGLTDKQLAEILDVSEMTINRWKKESPEFLLALKKGKLEADLKAQESLFKRVTGYKYEEYHKEFEVNESGKEKIKSIKRIKKEVIPDTAACFIWLKNRMPDQWKDKHEVQHSGGVKIISDDIK